MVFEGAYVTSWLNRSALEGQLHNRINIGVLIIYWIWTPHVSFLAELALL